MKTSSDIEALQGQAKRSFNLLTFYFQQNQLITARPVQSDKGEALMKKMGWHPGEGLGKFKQGPSAPFEISLKTDRKGLSLKFEYYDFYKNFIVDYMLVQHSFVHY